MTGNRTSSNKRVAEETDNGDETDMSMENR